MLTCNLTFEAILFSKAFKAKNVNLRINIWAI